MSRITSRARPGLIAAGRAAAALPLLATLACGGGSAPEPALEAPRASPRIRLLDFARGSEGGIGEEPEAWRRSHVLGPRKRRVIRRVALEVAAEIQEERLALVGSVESEFRFEVDVPDGAVLRFGAGAGRTPAEPATTGGAIVGRVRVASGEETSTLIEEALGEIRWRDHELDLSPWAGSTVELALTADGPQDAWIAWSSPEILRPSGTDGGWDVLVVSLDTLRADRLGSYGHFRPTSPNLDALGSRSFRFSTTVAAAPWTLPSHQALFSGLYPLSRGGLEGEARRRNLALVLHAAGYRTEARTGGGVMDFRIGHLATGFDAYRVDDWLRDLDGLENDLGASAGRRRFLFLHTYEPHDPYIDTRFAEGLPPGRLEGRFDSHIWPRIRAGITDEEKRYVEALYDGDIAFTDERIGDLLRRLEASGALARTIVVVTSDHGEQFWEHGSWRHGQNLYDEQILVPFFLHVPEGLRKERGIGRDSGVIDQQVRLVDVFPTILDLLGLESPGPLHGRSLVPLLRGERLPEAEALAESLNLEYKQSKAIRFGGFKYLRNHLAEPGKEPSESSELYDLGADPEELADLISLLADASAVANATDSAGRRQEVVAALAARLEVLAGRDWAGEAKTLEGAELDDDLRARLRALGYLGN